MFKSIFIFGIYILTIVVFILVITVYVIKNNNNTKKLEDHT